jgi:Flp pilus assembly protein TadG
MRRRGASFFRHLIFDEAGAAGAIVALSLVALLGVAALATDLGFLYTAQMKLQASTDAAALAGAQDINVGAGGTAITTATAYSSAPGGANATNNLPATMAPGFPRLKCLLTIHIPCAGTDGAVNAIVVTENASVPTFFAKVFGIQSWNISATALAGAGGGVQGPIDIMLVLDTVGGNSLLGAGLSVSDPASLTDLPNAPCRMNMTPGENILLSLLFNQCTGSGTKLRNALAGFRTLLLALEPCSPSLASCGAATNGNVANPYAEVGLTVFPGLTNAGQAQYDYDTGFCSTATQPAIAAYYSSPTYQIVPLSSDYRTSDAATSLSGASNLALAAGGASGCGLWAVNPPNL